MFYVLLISDATVIIYTVVTLLTIAGLSVLLFFAIKKNYLQEKEQKQALIVGTFTWPEMVTTITKYTASSEKPTYTLLYVDIDKFSQFTTVFGKKEGNELIKTVAKKILSVVPKKSLVCRYKDDRFIIFFSSTYKADIVYDYGKDILKEFRVGLTTFNNVEIDLTASICMAQFPIHGKTLDLLVDSLKLGILKIKRNGGDDFFVYSGSLVSSVKDAEYSNELSKAIENKEFRLYYKPIYDRLTMRVIGYETSTRWENPELGIIEPKKFINTMEQTGDILWIGQWGFESLVGKYLQLKQKHESVPLLTFKLSPKQLINEKMPNLINRLLKRFSAPASNFILEIGEFALFAKDTMVNRNINILKKMGFLIAITDFTTEPKNFHILETLGIDYVVFNINLYEEVLNKDNEYIRQFLEYMHDHNKMVITTNVDSEEQQQWVTDKNLTLVIGDYYHQAVNGVDVLEIPLNQ